MSKSNETVTCGIGIFTIGPECSGNGNCVFDPSFQRGVCQCFEGWTGFADFQGKLNSKATDISNKFVKNSNIESYGLSNKCSCSSNIMGSMLS